MNEVKEMVYRVKRLNPPEILTSGEVEGYKYYVISMGMWPCAYVSIPKDDINFGKNNIQIECHGGITYERDYLLDVETNAWVIGWDYSHCFDYIGYNALFPVIDDDIKQKKYTTEEMIMDCRSVINQLINLNDKNF